MCVKTVLSSLLLVAAISGSQGFLLEELVLEIFRDYEPAVRPRCDVTGATNVTMGMALRQIVDLNEPLQILSTIVWIRLTWRDCRLGWNVSQFEGLEELVVPQSRVWVPDITLYDNADKSVFGTEEFNLVITHRGQIRYNFPVLLKSLCAVDSTHFPFDSQACKLTFGSWMYSGRNINISTGTSLADMTSYIQNTEWFIENVPVIRQETYYGEEFYPTISYILRVDRRPLFYILNLLFPCCLISSVAVLGFLLPPASGEKMNLEITVMLSLSVFQLIVLEMMPPAGDRVPFIAMYFTVSMILVGLSCLATVIILNIHFKGFRATPIPPWVVRYIYRPLAVLTRTDVTEHVGWNTHIETRMERIRRGSLTCGNYFRRMSTCSNRSETSQRTRITSTTGYNTADSRSLDPGQNGVDNDPHALASVTSESQDVYGRTAPYKTNKTQNDVLRLIESVNSVIESLNENMFFEGTEHSQSPNGASWSVFALMLDRLFMGVYILCLATGMVGLSVRYIVLTEEPEIVI